jgi:hypothetical protein
MGRDSQWRGRRAGAGLALFAIVAFAACGGGGQSGTYGASAGAANGAGSATGAQPSRNGTFAPGILVDIPKPGGAQPLSGPIQQGSTTTQTFRVDGLSPSALIVFYESALTSGWTVSSPAAPLGRCVVNNDVPAVGCTYRGSWTSGPQTLLITTSSDTSTVGNSINESQLTLEVSGAG